MGYLPIHANNSQIWSIIHTYIYMHACMRAYLHTMLYQSCRSSCNVEHWRETREKLDPFLHTHTYICIMHVIHKRMHMPCMDTLASCRPLLGQMLLSHIGQMSPIQKVSISTLALNTILDHLGVSHFLSEKLHLYKMHLTSSVE